MKSQGYKMPPTRIRQDNKSTIRLLENGQSNSDSTRHINIKYFATHDRIIQGDCVLFYTPTLEMIADILTKPVTGPLFQELASKLLGEST